MNQKQSSETIEGIIGKSFLRVAKNHGKYFIIMQMFRKLPRKMVSSEKTDSNRSIEVPKSGKYMDFIQSLRKFSKEHQENRPSNMDMRNTKRYEYITTVINHLLHNLLERGGVHPQELGLYGQEIFDLSCYSAFGDEFISDMEIMRQQHPEMMNRNDLRMKLESEYRSRCDAGERINFENFMMKYHRDLIPALQEMDNNHEVDDYIDEDDWYESHDDDENRF